MKKHMIIDNRMREIEKSYLQNLGYNLLELNKSNNTYEEISSHVDIFCVKINNSVIFEKYTYAYIINKLQPKSILNNINIICGDSVVAKKYPLDISYNVCQIGKYVVHNFEYTDLIVRENIDKYKLTKINVKQGYTNCSIAVIDDNSVIVSDPKIYDELKRHGIDVLLVSNELDIKLLKYDGTYSNMKGFIGGCITRVDNKVIVFGDLDYIDKEGYIRNFIESKNLNIVEFKDLNIIDYGSVLYL